MRFRERQVDRGQSIQIGALLLFAILVISLSMYQVFAVPAQNERVEFKHNERVQDQLVGLRNSIQDTAASGVGRSTSVPLGSQYPNRGLFINPPPASGQLRTVGEARADVAVRVSNAQATDGETRDLWNGTYAADDPGDVGYYTTASVVYDPAYNYYENAPTTVVENSVVYNEFPNGGTRTLTEQSLVDGRRITLVSYAGSYSDSGARTGTVDVNPASAPSNEIAVTNAAGERVNVTVATRLEESMWVELLSSQIDGYSGATTCAKAGDGPGTDSDPDRYVVTCEWDDNGEFSNLTVVMEQGATYTLRTARVGVGNFDSSSEVRYITTDQKDTITVPTDGEVSLTAEVRNRFDTPVSGVTVTGSASGSGTLDSSTERSDASGEVEFVYDAPDAAGTETVTLTIDGGGSDAETVSYTMNVQSNSAPGSGIQYGYGGTSTYSSSDDTRTVTVDNGKWTGVTELDEYVVSNADPSYKPSQSAYNLTVEVLINNTTTSESYVVRFRYKDPSGNPPTGRTKITRIPGSTKKAKTYTAATNRTLNTSIYNGTDLFDPTSYRQAPTTLVSHVSNITEASGEQTNVTTTIIEGRVDITLREQVVISATQANPTEDDGDDLEFVRISFESATDTGGWTLRDDEGDVTQLPNTTLSGDIYFARDPSQFASTRGFDASKVYELNTPLDDAGDRLLLKDGRGRWRDETAYVDVNLSDPAVDNDTNPDAATSRGWRVDEVQEGNVSFRQFDSTVGYLDNDSATTWNVTTQLDFFGVSGTSIVFVRSCSSCSGKSIWTLGESGRLTTFGEDPAGISSLGPESDYDDDGQEEVPYVDGSKKQLRLLEPDNSTETLVSDPMTKPKQQSLLATEDIDGDGLASVYYANQSNFLYRYEYGNSSARPIENNTETTGPSLGSEPAIVRAKGVFGNADFDGDGFNETIYIVNQSAIGYLDYEQTNGAGKIIGSPADPGNGAPAGNTTIKLDSQIKKVAGSKPIERGGEWQVPVVTGNSNISLVNDAGTMTTLLNGNNGAQPKATPVATVDWDADSDVEIIFINNNDNSRLYLLQLEDAGPNNVNDVTAVTDSAGDKLKAKQQGVR